MAGDEGAGGETCDGDPGHERRDKGPALLVCDLISMYAFDLCFVLVYVMMCEYFSVYV